MISYHGGMFGDFLCTKISQDQNFYTQSSNEVEMNRYNFPNPFEKYNLNLHHWILPTITDQQSEKISVDYSEQHLCFPTHWYGNLSDVNLSRLIGVRIVGDQRLALLTYLLSWIKANRKISLIDNWIHEFNQIKIKYPHLSPWIERIVEKGHFYRFEKNCLSKGFSNYKIFIQNDWNLHQKTIINKELHSWKYLNISGLFFEYSKFSDEFQKHLSLSQEIKESDVTEYHRKNLNLIRDEIGIEYFQIKKINWMNVLFRYISFTTDSIIGE